MLIFSLGLLLFLATALVEAGFMRYDYPYDYGEQDELLGPDEGQCRAPPVATAIIPSYPRGTTFSISCPAGFELVGESSSVCTSSGSWTVPTVGSCRKSK